MTTIAILIILIVVQLLVGWLLPVRELVTKLEPSVKAERSWSCDWACYGSAACTTTTSLSQVAGLRYGGSYDYSLSYSQRQPLVMAKKVVESPFYIEEIDEQDQYETSKPQRKIRRFSKHDLTKRRQYEKSELRRGQRAIKAMMRA
jgi:hypothetical protein